jgi:hypothetical protein
MAPLNPQNEFVRTMSLATLALQIAQGQLGQCEEPKGSNSGPMVNQYLLSVGLGAGYAWCQAFVHWCYQQAADQLKQENPVVKTAGAIDCWNKTATQYKLPGIEAWKHPVSLKPGDQFIMNYGHGEGHTGVIEKIEGSILYTIEGNSNNDGSREGYEVVRHKRSLNDKLLIGFIQY